MRMMRMGLKEKQLGGVVGAYFRGVDLPRLGSNMSAVGPELMAKSLANAPGNLGVGIFRGAVAGGAGLAAWNMMPRNDILAGAGAIGAFYGGYAGLGRYTSKFARTMMGGAMGTAGEQLTRGATGLMAGSMVWSGLRTQRPADFMMRG